MSTNTRLVVGALLIALFVVLSVIVPMGPFYAITLIGSFCGGLLFGNGLARRVNGIR